MWNTDVLALIEIANLIYGIGSLLYWYPLARGTPTLVAEHFGVLKPYTQVCLQQASASTVHNAKSEYYSAALRYSSLATVPAEGGEQDLCLHLLLACVSADHRPTPVTVQLQTLHSIRYCFTRSN
jgi:hypothetical protein